MFIFSNKKKKKKRDHNYKRYITMKKVSYLYRGKKILIFSLVLRTSTPKFLLVLLPNNTGHSR